MQTSFTEYYRFLSRPGAIKNTYAGCSFLNLVSSFVF